VGSTRRELDEREPPRGRPAPQRVRRDYIVAASKHTLRPEFPINRDARSVANTVHIRITLPPRGFNPLSDFEVGSQRRSPAIIQEVGSPAADDDGKRERNERDAL